MVSSIAKFLEMSYRIFCLCYLIASWLPIEDMCGLKLDMNFFKMLNGERLVDLKHKPLEDKEVTKISGHQGLLIQER